MTQGHEARTLSVWINRDPHATYAFVGNPRNLPAWASGLGHSIKERDGAWIVQTPNGPARLRFAEANPFGVLDHSVEPRPGVTIYIPMRVGRTGRAAR
ncbi:MAG: hypothetical protein QJR07_15270 [Acetobacteraceae bacterium]|nr:hypothetical protein [Acetobacteraceae bacterium]